MDDNNVKVYKLITIENSITVLATALCVGLIALGTGSLHCLWGLLILLNITTLKGKNK